MRLPLDGRVGGGGWAADARYRADVARCVARSVVRTLARAIVPGGRNSLLALRAKRLLAMGYTGPALELLTLAPPGVLDEDLSRRAAEALFLVDDPDGACKLVANASRYVTPYWRQANAFCLAVGGDTARSAMVADILRERGGDVSPGFFALMEALDGGAAPSLESANGPPGLMMAMLRAAGAAPPAQSAPTPRTSARCAPGPFLQRACR